jgi:hypothetical protein
LKEGKTVGIIIGVAVAIILGVVLVGVIANQTQDKSTLKSQTDTVNIAPLRMVGGGLNYTLAEANKLYADKILTHPAGNNWKSDYSGCAITTVKYYNQSGALMSSADDYTWVEDGNGGIGWLRLKNVNNLNNSMVNSTTITYNYCPDEYVAESWQRTVLNMVPGFFVLAILLGTAFVIIWILRQEGVDIGI